jgi:two-component system phosphate regulon response regulator PhoB
MHDLSPAAVAARAGKPLVLLVEDDPAQLSLLAKIFSDAGCVVIQVSTSKDALASLRQVPVCLVVADHMLRGVTGTQLAAKLKAIKPSVPILLHSGTQPETMRNVDAFLHKGEPVAELLALARDLIRRFAT